MNSTILFQVTPDQLQEMIEAAIDKKLQPPLEKKFIPKNIASQRLKRTVQTLDSWHKAGILKKKYIGGRVYYLESDIERIESK